MLSRLRSRSEGAALRFEEMRGTRREEEVLWRLEWAVWSWWEMPLTRATEMS